ncbi:MAG: hypothetical protein JHD00_01610 [Akkermansiaceae bacterium]|nr:hypothetical protein [Akkermansiaceae bacterium]
MTNRSRIFLIIILTSAVGLWWSQRESTRKVNQTEDKRLEKPFIVPQSAMESLSTALAPPTQNYKTAESADSLSQPQRLLVFAAIDNLEFTFRDFSNALGGNPVGTNAEITSALLGDNLKQVKLPLPEGSTRNEAGELCDPWQTPWFFHQISGSKMEIRSAGPDMELYTADDFVH